MNNTSLENRVEKKFKIGEMAFRYWDLFDFDSFYNSFRIKVEVGIRYSILLRVSYENSKTGDVTEYRMLGTQIFLDKSTELEMKEFVYWLVDTIIQRNKESMDVYKYSEHDIINIQIILFRLDKVISTKIKRVDRESFGEQKDLFNVSKFLEDLQEVPLNVDYSKLGVLLDREINNNWITKIKLVNGELIDTNKFFYQYNKAVLLLDSNTQIYEKGNLLLVLNKSEGGIKTNIKTYNKGGMFINSINFKQISKDNFYRQSGNVVLYVNNKGVYNRTIDLTLPNVYTHKLSGKLSRMIQPEWRIGSLDLETFVDNGDSKTYAIGFYTKDSINTFYINENLDSDALIIDCLSSMLTDKYDGYVFYVHQFSQYDVYFIFRLVISREDLFSCVPTFKDDKIIGLKISRKVISINKNTGKINTKRFTIKIVDSYTMLQGKLAKLAESFNSTVLKSEFPYNFVNRYNLQYKGKKPDIEYYNNIDDETYNNISNNWSLKDETLNYLSNDLISLYNVMESFIKKIYINYHVHASSSLTISSLSMDIFLRRFYNNNIPLIKQKSMYNDIKKSYYGGTTEVYKPYGKDLYYYDVNSLYPFSSLNSMPGTECKYIDNINKKFNVIGDQLFGFYYCSIKTSNGYLGLLPTRSNDGLVNPLGEFEGWYFSEELRQASENGYDILVERGYSFNKVEKVFNKYVEHLYSIKRDTKDVVEKQIVKRLLNHLLGRFGLDINKYISSVVNLDEFEEIIQTRKFKNVHFIGDKVLLSYDVDVNKNICENHGLDYHEVINNFKASGKKFEDNNNHNNVSVAISSAVTAYSRVFMNKVKLDIIKRGGMIYYSDTDSIVTDQKLRSKQVGPEIGQFKLVDRISEGYFISNKTYGYKNVKGEVVTINKGFEEKTLKFEDFVKLYKGNVVVGNKTTTERSYSKGTATINKVYPDINPDSYTKRVKIFNNGMWIDTKPLINKKNYHTNNIKIKPISILYTILLYYMLPLLVIIAGFTVINYVDIYIIDMCVIDNNINNIVDNIEDLYSSEYLEDEDYIDLNTYNRKSSIFDWFIKKFYCNNDILTSKYSIKYDNIMKDDINLSHIEKPNVIDEIRKYYIQSLDAENLELKDKISTLEIQLQKYRINRISWNNIVDNIIKDLEKGKIEGVNF